MYAFFQQVSRTARLAAVLVCALALAACGAAGAAGGPTTDPARASAPLGAGQHSVLSSDGRDPYLSARDPGTGEFVRDIATGEPLYAVRATAPGAEQHVVLSSDGRDPYLSARDPGTGELVRDIATGEPLYACDPTRCPGR